MSIFEKHRFEIWNQSQHPYKHSLSEFSYTNPALPNITNVESTLNYLVAVLYPNTQDAVATVGDLPAIGNTINDYRVVLDDGDGKADTSDTTAPMTISWDSTCNSCTRIRTSTTRRSSISCPAMT